MSYGKSKNESIEDKFNKYQKDIKNERIFLFKINQLLNEEYEEIFEDILVLNEKQFMSELKNRVESELESIYSDKILSEKKFNNFLEKGLNSIKSDYISDHQIVTDAYDNYSKNKNSKKNQSEFLTHGYRRHCAREVDNHFATHICNSNLGKFILAKKSGKVEFVICSNCRKVYFSNMILCKCYKCSKEYYTEILSKNDDEFLLPATWENYHCKQICNEKIQCIKCQETLYINLKTGMLNCLNKKCNFVSKANKIMWTCSICQEDFKSGAIPYNPLDLEIIKKIIKQTLLQGQRAHPSRVPCCKTNVFFTEFSHKKKCNGILYTGEYNDDIVVVCEKCRAINFIDRFVWTCPKCGNKFKDEKENEEKDHFVTIKLNEKKKSDHNYISNHGYSSTRNKIISLGNIKKPFYSNRNIENTNNEDNKSLGKDKELNIKRNNLNINNINDNYNSEKYSSTIEPPSPVSFKKIYNSRFNKKKKITALNNSKEKEKESNSNYNNDNNDILYKDNEGENKDADDKIHKFKRLRFYTVNDLNKQNKENETKSNNNKNQFETEENEDKSKEKNEQNNKNEKASFKSFNSFMQYRKKRKMEEKAKEEETVNKTDFINVNKRINKDKDIKEKDLKEKENKEDEEKKKNVDRRSIRLIPYRSFKKNYNTENKENKDDKENKESADKVEKIPKKEKEKEFPKKSFFSKKMKYLEKEKSKPKLDEEEEIEEDDIKLNKRNKIEIAEKGKPKKEEANPSPNFNKRWKFRRPEPKNTSGKIVKEENSFHNYSSHNNENTNISKEREKEDEKEKEKEKEEEKKEEKDEEKEEEKDEEKEEENSYKKNSYKKNKAQESNDNSNTNNANNGVAYIPATNIPGMSDKLLNHINRRISSIISKSSIPLMNVEDYILNKKIGQGSYGIIFSAISKKDKKQYALKKIISNKLKQIGEFIKEFELVHLCNHENIMKIYSYCIRILDPTTYALYVLMELSDGDWDKEIKKKLLKRKNYSEMELINILYQLVSALLYIQEKFHLSHRDIKPQNVLVYPDGKYKLADFGEAKEAKVSRQINTLRGTELYMSPALYNGLKNEKNDVSHNPYKSDVFSLGFCFLYASALNFNLLYEVRDILDSRGINIILHKFLNKIYSEKLIQLLASMLEIDESKRYDFNGIKTYIEKNYPNLGKEDN